MSLSETSEWEAVKALDDISKYVKEVNKKLAAFEDYANVAQPDRAHYERLLAFIESHVERLQNILSKLEAYVAVYKDRDEDNVIKGVIAEFKSNIKLLKKVSNDLRAEKQTYEFTELMNKRMLS